MRCVPAYPTALQTRFLSYRSSAGHSCAGSGKSRGGVEAAAAVMGGNAQGGHALAGLGRDGRGRREFFVLCGVVERASLTQKRRGGAGRSRRRVSWGGNDAHTLAGLGSSAVGGAIRQFHRRCQRPAATETASGPKPRALAGRELPPLSGVAAIASDQDGGGKRCHGRAGVPTFVWHAAGRLSSPRASCSMRIRVEPRGSRPDSMCATLDRSIPSNSASWRWDRPSD